VIGIAAPTLIVPPPPELPLPPLLDSDEDEPEWPMA